MDCKLCGKAVPDGCLYCPYCGTKKDASPLPCVAPASAESEQVEVITPTSSELPPKRKRSKKLLLVLAISVVLIAAAGVVVWLLFFNQVPDAVVYFGDDGLVYDNLRGTSVELSDEVSTYHPNACPQVSQNGNRLFYIAEGDLFYCDTKRSAEPHYLARDVWNFFATDDGSHVFYITYNDGNFSLHWCDIKGNGEQIAKHIMYREAIDLYITEDGNTIFYMSMSGKSIVSSEDIVLYKAYFKGNQLVTEKIAKYADLYCASPDGEQIAYRKDGSLYVQSGEEKAVKVCSESWQLLRLCDKKMCYYQQKGAVYFFDGTDSHRLTDTDPSVYISPKHISEPVVAFRTAEGNNVIAIKDQVVDIPLEDVRYAIIRNDGKEALVITGDESGNGDAYTIPIGEELGKPQKALENVRYAWYTEDGRHLVLGCDSKDGSKYTLYIDNQRVADDVADWDYDTVSGVFVFKTDQVNYADATLVDHYSLWVVDGEKNHQIGELITDYEFSPGGAVAFLSGDELYYYKDNKVVQLAEDVTHLYPVRYYE